MEIREAQELESPVEDSELPGISTGSFYFSNNNNIILRDSS